MPAARICRRQFAIAVSRLNIILARVLFFAESSEHGVHYFPLREMFLQRPFAVLLERVVFTFATNVALGPARPDQAFGFHSVKDRLEHAVGPFKLVSGARSDLLHNGVTITFTLPQQRQNERFSRGGDEFFWYHRGTIHSSTL